MERFAETACLHLVSGSVYAATGIIGDTQQRSAACAECGVSNDGRRPGEHRAGRHVPGWAEILRAERRLDRSEGIERTIKSGFHLDRYEMRIGTGINGEA